MAGIGSCNPLTFTCFHIHQGPLIDTSGRYPSRDDIYSVARAAAMLYMRRSIGLQKATLQREASALLSLASCILLVVLL